jgi:chemotaxis protein MotB
VRQDAVPIIEKLAGVLQSPVAQTYEVRVVGHTDDVPMKNAANLRQFGDNWGLSTARAISVMKQFRSAGIPETRMSVAGYGEFQPVAENGAKGAEANRRVEVFLVPKAGQPGSNATTPVADDDATADTAATSTAETEATAASENETVGPADSSTPTDNLETPEMFK